MRRFFPCLLSLLAILLIVLPPLQAAASPVRGTGEQTRPTEPTPTPTRPPVAPPTAEEILAKMSVAEKVGQLFIISFQGRDVAPDSEIAILVRDYGVGGVVLLPQNGNYSNSVAGGSVADPLTGEATPRSTPLQIATLASALQALAASPARPISPPAPVTATLPITAAAVVTPAAAITGSLPLSPTAVLTPTATVAPTATLTPTAPIAITAPGLNLPLLVALDWSGDDSSFLSGRGGFTPLASSMALGATWSPQLAEQVGQVMGQELKTAGISLILGPALDVLDVPRPGSKGDMDTRSFGGDPFWVGQIGQAFIRGVQAGSGGNVGTAAKHFPGQGGSDRTPEDEVATIQKSVQQLQQIELAPFATVANGSDLTAPGVTAALMTSHIRYRGFQGNIRELTPPISLAPQLQDLMELDELAAWRSAGGVLMSDALGVPAIRRYYDPSLTRFPHRQVAQDAFLAGNDLLYLHRFALTDNWEDQVAAIKETLLFFQEKYKTDAAFAARVDASVDRIVRMKMRLFGPSLQPPQVEDLRAAPNAVGQSTNVTRSVARSGLTLIYPGREEFADRMPTAPLENEKILIFTDAREKAECATCTPEAIIAPNALEQIILQLYGPEATGQIKPSNVRSLTFTDLYNLLNSPQGEASEIEAAIADSRWIIFAQLDLQPTEHPESAALRNFLARRSDSLRDKRLVVLAFRAPYYLDTTEISKLTAYFGVYGTTAPFLETAVRAVFREFSPVGAPPVTVTGINYELINQLEPAPGQIIPVNPIGSGDVISGSIQVGSQIELEAGVIRDHNGHPVPDGTLVEFYLRYPAESLALAPKIETTVDGKARTVVPLDRPGELWITAQSGEARNSTRIELRVGGDSPGSIATVVPTPTPSPTATPTITPSPTATATATLAPTVTPAPPPQPPPPTPRVALPSYLAGLAGVVGAGGIAFSARKRNGRKADPNRPPDVDALAAALWAVATAWCAYLLYAVGWLPGSTDLQTKGYVWAAGLVTLAGGLVSLLWTARTKPGESD